MAKDNIDRQMESADLSFDIGSPDMPKEGAAKTTYQFFTAGLKGVRDGVLNNLDRELSANIPNTMGVANEVVNTISTLKDIGTEFTSELAGYINTTRRAAARALPLTRKIIPGKIYGLIERKLTEGLPDEDGQVDEATRMERQRADSVSTAVNSTFNSTMEYNKERDARDIVEKMRDRKQSVMQHRDLVKNLGYMDKSLKGIEKFLSSSMYPFMKKTLELQYQQWYTQKDILNRVTAQSKISEYYLKALVHNTGLPEYAKTSMTQVLKGSLRASMGQRFSSHASNLFRNMLTNLKDKTVGALKDQLGSFVSQLDMASSFAEMAAQSGMELTKKDLAKSGLGWLGGMLGQQGIRKLSQAIAPFAEDLEGGMAHHQEKLSMYLMDLKDKWAYEPGVKSWLAEIIPDFYSNSRVSNTMLKDWNATVPFDQTVRQSIVEVIPGYLAQMLKSFEDFRTNSDTPLQVFDPIKRTFTDVASMRNTFYDYVIGEHSSSIIETTSLVGASFRKKQGNNVRTQALYKDSRKLVERFIAYSAATHATLRPTVILKVARDEDLYEEDEIAYYEKVFAPLGKEGATQAAMMLSGALFNPDGSVDSKIRNELVNAIIKEARNDNIKELLPMMMEGFGHRRHFKEDFDKYGYFDNRKYLTRKLDISDAAREKLYEGEDEAADRSLDNYYARRKANLEQINGTDGWKQENSFKNRVLSKNIPILNSIFQYLPSGVDKILSEMFPTAEDLRPKRSVQDIVNDPRWNGTVVERAALERELAMAGKDKAVDAVKNIFSRKADPDGSDAAVSEDTVEGTTRKGKSKLDRAKRIARIKAWYINKQSRVVGSKLSANIREGMLSREEFLDAVPPENREAMESFLNQFDNVADALKVLKDKDALKAKLDNIVDAVSDTDLRKAKTKSMIGSIFSFYNKATDSDYYKQKYEELKAKGEELRDKALEKDGFIDRNKRRFEEWLETEKAFREQRREERAKKYNLPGLSFTDDAESKFHSDFRMFAERQIEFDKATLEIMLSGGLTGNEWGNHPIIGGIFRGLGATGRFLGRGALAGMGAIGNTYRGLGHVAKGMLNFGGGALHMGANALRYGLPGTLDLIKELGVGYFKSVGEIGKGFFTGAGHALGGIGTGLGLLLGGKHIERPLFVDIYVNDGSAVPGQPAIPAKWQQLGRAVYENGKPIKDSYSINKPVFDKETGNVLITQEDLEHGLVDKDGKELIPMMMMRAGGLLGIAGRGIGGLIGGLFGLGKSALGLYGKGLHGLGKLAFGGIKGVGTWLGRALGLDMGRTYKYQDKMLKWSDEVIVRMNTLIELITDRTPMHDYSGDGYRDNSYEEYRARKAQSALERAFGGSGPKTSRRPSGRGGLGGAVLGGIAAGMAGTTSGAVGTAADGGIDVSDTLLGTSGGWWLADKVFGKFGPTSILNKGKGIAAKGVVKGAEGIGKGAASAYKFGTSAAYRQGLAASRWQRAMASAAEKAARSKGLGAIARNKFITKGPGILGWRGLGLTNILKSPTLQGALGVGGKALGLAALGSTVYDIGSGFSDAGEISGEGSGIMDPTVYRDASLARLLSLGLLDEQAMYNRVRKFGDQNSIGLLLRLSSMGLLNEDILAKIIPSIKNAPSLNDIDRSMYDLRRQIVTTGVNTLWTGGKAERTFSADYKFLDPFQAKNIDEESNYRNPFYIGMSVDQFNHRYGTRFRNLPTNASEYEKFLAVMAGPDRFGRTYRPGYLEGVNISTPEARKIVAKQQTIRASQKKLADTMESKYGDSGFARWATGVARRYEQTPGVITGETADVIRASGIGESARSKHFYRVMKQRLDITHPELRSIMSLMSNQSYTGVRKKVEKYGPLARAGSFPRSANQIEDPEDRAFFSKFRNMEEARQFVIEFDTKWKYVLHREEQDVLDAEGNVSKKESERELDKLRSFTDGQRQRYKRDTDLRLGDKDRFSEMQENETNLAVLRLLSKEERKFLRDYESASFYDPIRNSANHVRYRELKKKMAEIEKDLGITSKDTTPDIAMKSEAYQGRKLHEYDKLKAIDFYRRQEADRLAKLDQRKAEQAEADRLKKLSRDNLKELSTTVFEGYTIPVMRYLSSRYPRRPGWLEWREFTDLSTGEKHREAVDFYTRYARQLKDIGATLTNEELLKAKTNQDEINRALGLTTEEKKKTNAYQYKPANQQTQAQPTVVNVDQESVVAAIKEGNLGQRVQLTQLLEAIQDSGRAFGGLATALKSIPNLPADTIKQLDDYTNRFASFFNEKGNQSGSSDGISFDRKLVRA